MTVNWDDHARKFRANVELRAFVRDAVDIDYDQSIDVGPKLAYLLLDENGRKYRITVEEAN